MNELGKHYIIELEQCAAETISSVPHVELAMLEAARLSGAHILQHAFHQFEPQGVSGFLFIEESHFSIHTWPEHGYAAIDVFTCGPMDVEKAIDSLKASFEAGICNVRTLARGPGTVSVEESES